MINRNYIASPKTWHSVSIVAIIYIRTESGKSMSIQVPNVMKQAIFLYSEVPNNCTAYFITYVEFYAGNLCPSTCQHIMGWESEYWFCASLLKMGQKWEYLLRFRPISSIFPNYTDRNSTFFLILENFLAYTTLLFWEIPIY